MEDPDARTGQEGGRARARHLRFDQRLAHDGELANVRMEFPEQPDLIGSPASALGGIAEPPYDTQVVRGVQPHVEAVPRLRVDQRLVVGGRGLLLRVGVQISRGHQPPGLQARDAGGGFVSGPVIVEVPGLPVLAAASGEADPRKEDCRMGPLRLMERQGAAAHAIDLAHRAIRLGPPRFVERGLVKRCQDAIERTRRRRHCAHMPSLPSGPERGGRPYDHENGEVGSIGV